MKKILSLLLALALVLSLGLVASTPVMAQSWLSGWSYRVEITIHSDKIDGALVDFPVLLYLSTSSGIDPDDVSFIFDELGTEKLKLAVTTDDGTTQCYVEIEKWDDANEQAWLWVKVPSISSSANTTLYLYYDSTQPDNTTWVGETGTPPAENVWDSDFMVVYHMADGADTSHVYDSTSHSHDGTKTGANAPQETTIAKMGVAQVFDGSDDQITLTAGDLDDLDTATIEICAKFHTISSSSSDGGGLWAFIKSSTDRVHLKSVSSDELRLYDDIDGVSSGTSTTDSPFDTTNWFQLVVTLDSGGLWTAYINNTQKFTQDDNKTFADLDNGFQTHIGSKQYAAPLYHDGELDEFRVSKTVRSPAWIKATYHSSNDNLLSYGSQESPPPPPILQVYGLIITSNEGGRVTKPGQGHYVYDPGTVVKLVATPDDGYRFVEWTHDVRRIADVNAASTTITMYYSYWITANFEPEETPPVEPQVQYELSVSSTMGGSVTSPGEGTFPYIEGTVVSLVANPATGYEFVNWTGDGITSVDSTTTTVTMNGDHSIKANFEFEQTTGTDSGGESSVLAGCFIATAAYGSPTAEQIDVLREFRDIVLVENSVGSQFVALYYRLSPAVADFIAGNNFLRTLVRELLVDPVVWIVEATGAIWRN